MRHSQTVCVHGERAKAMRKIHHGFRDDSVEQRQADVVEQRLFRASVQAAVFDLLVASPELLVFIICVSVFAFVQLRGKSLCDMRRFYASGHSWLAREDFAGELAAVLSDNHSHSLQLLRISIAEAAAVSDGLGLHRESYSGCTDTVKQLGTAHRALRALADQIAILQLHGYDAVHLLKAEPRCHV